MFNGLFQSSDQNMFKGTLQYFFFFEKRLILQHFKGIVHFEINFLYVLAYLKGIQDVGVFDSQM